MRKFKTETELKKYATEQSESIVIRTYVNGSSEDTRRKATKAEQKITLSCIYGALLAINNGRDLQSCMDTAEFTANLLFKSTTTSEKHPNNFDSVYCPIYNFTW